MEISAEYSDRVELGNYKLVRHLRETIKASSQRYRMDHRKKNGAENASRARKTEEYLRGCARGLR